MITSKQALKPLAARRVVGQAHLPDLFWQIKEIGENCWHLHCGQEACLAAKGRVYPVTLPQSACDEPLLPLGFRRIGNPAASQVGLVLMKKGGRATAWYGFLRGQPLTRRSIDSWLRLLWVISTTDTMSFSSLME